MNPDYVTQQITKLIEAGGQSVKSLIKMDQVWQDKAIYAGGVSLTNAPLFAANQTGKDSQSQTQTFPLQQGKYYAVYGIRATHNVQLATSGLSTTVAFNQQLFEQESTINIQLDKTILNGIPLDLCLPWDYYNNALTISQVAKQNWSAYYFSDPLIMPLNGNVQMTFAPRTGLTTAAAGVATNPFYISANGATKTEAFTVNFKLLVAEFTAEFA